MTPVADIGIIGLAVMGQNLALNMDDHGFTVVVFNRTVEKVDHFLANEARGTRIVGAHSLEELIGELKRPRRVMLLVWEAYDLLRHVLGLTTDDMSRVFAEWNAGQLNSYLVEITADILAYKDADGAPLLDKILDAAGQKGTGKWADVPAFDYGVPLTLIGEAVFARDLSALKDERVAASRLLGTPVAAYTGDRTAFIDDLEQSLYAAKIVSYTQGYMLMRTVSHELGWNLAYGNIALMWRGGCIIRAAFLDDIKAAFEKQPDLDNLLLDSTFTKRIQRAAPAWRRVVAAAVSAGLPVPAMSSALAFLDGYRREPLPANLLQAQRDYFGAHTYERIDRPRGEFLHTNWTGQGGEVTSTAYNTSL